MKKKCIIADGGGTALYAAFQSSKIRKNDRLVCSSSISSMGTGLAETIGVTKSNKFKKYLCIIGDGSFLMNVQDLQNIAQDGKNVVIILVNNNGYLAIRHTQKEFLQVKNDLNKLRKFVEKNFEFAGDQFVKKIRSAYYDKNNKKSYYGTTTPEERDELKEEGIDLLTIPWIDKDN